jgi:hypothetical protein
MVQKRKRRIFGRGVFFDGAPSRPYLGMKDPLCAAETYEAGVTPSNIGKVPSRATISGVNCLSPGNHAREGARFNIEMLLMMRPIWAFSRSQPK